MSECVSDLRLIAEHEMYADHAGNGLKPAEPLRNSLKRSLLLDVLLLFSVLRAQTLGTTAVCFTAALLC